MPNQTRGCRLFGKDKKDWLVIINNKQSCEICGPCVNKKKRVYKQVGGVDIFFCLDCFKI